jgi:polyhydroxybutyrate depolymerase
MRIHRSILPSLAVALPLLVTPALSTDASPGRQTLVHDGLTRSFVLRLPSQASRPDARLPLVIVLHGGGGNAANAEQMTGFTAKGRKEGFIVVYPEGTGPLEDKLLTWNAGHCCAYAMKNEVDDVGFIRALIQELNRRYPVDPRRVFVTGMSNGAMMSHRLGIELSEHVAAIAPVVGTLFGDERLPAKGVSAIMINGMLDQHVPWLGGPPGGRGAKSWDGTATQPAEKQFDFWLRASGCDKPAERTENRRWIVWRDNCDTPHSVTMYVIKDNGHAWPGGSKGSRRGDEPSSAMNATDVIWQFFSAQSK